MSDVSNMSEEFHDWLEKCPCRWVKKYGEPNYTFSEYNTLSKDDEGDKGSEGANQDG